VGASPESSYLWLMTPYRVAAERTADANRVVSALAVDDEDECLEELELDVAAGRSPDEEHVAHTELQPPGSPRKVDIGTAILVTMLAAAATALPALVVIGFVWREH